MEKQNKSGKFNWTAIVVTIIIIASLGTMVYFLFFRGVDKMSASQFDKIVQKDATSENDDQDYIKSMQFDYSLLKIYVQDVEGGQSHSYEVDAPTAAYMENYYGKPTTPSLTNPLVDQTLAKAFKDGNIDIKGTAVQTTSIWVSILINLIPIILIVGLMWFLLRKSMGAAGGAFGPSRSKAKAIKTNKKFSDIAGNEEVKEEVKELVHYLKNPSKYAAVGARIPKGILLGGPPGTGKTLIAKATAGEAEVPFFFISGSDFVEMFVGLGAARVREMFKDARKASPCILFIDELDAVGRSRGAGVGGGNDEREQTLNQILVEMDGITENQSILVLAATNRPDVLDPALLRPGRFDRIITVGLPDIKERSAIIRLHSKGKRLDPSIDFDNIARRTPGFSGAQLENVINEASLLSVRDGSNIIKSHHIDEAIDRVMAGPAKKSRTITGEELRAVAIHEAGHAVIGLKVASAEKVEKITIIPRGEAGGYTLMAPREQKYNYSKKELEAKIMSYLGGRASEQVHFGPEGISTGVSDDLKKATQIAKDMVTRFGMSELGPIQYASESGSMFLGRDIQTGKDHSDKIHYEIDMSVKKIISAAEEETIKIIEANKPLIALIVEALLDQETLVAEEFEYIAENMKLPPKKEAPVVVASKMPKISDLIAEAKGATQTTKVVSEQSQSSVKSKDATSVTPNIAKEDSSKTNKFVPKFDDNENDENSGNSGQSGQQ